MAEYEVQRSTTINAPADRVHALIDDFKAWRSWSPWEDVDPDLRREYAGAEKGVGSHYGWEGNRKAGKGSMDIVGSSPEQVAIKVSFEKPWKATNDAFFELQPAGEGATNVTWRMKGNNKGLAAVFAKFVSMDKLVGKDFEKGLAQLKVQAEAPPPA